MKNANIIFLFAVGLCLHSNAANESLNILELPDSTNVVVEVGDTLRVEYLRGGKTLYKSGEGRLEVAVVANSNLNVVVSNGTFAVVKPTTLDLSGDEHVIFHLDANALDKIEFSQKTGGGANFVTEVSDADGRTDRKLSVYPDRPEPMLLFDGINGLPAIDFGSLHNAAAEGYGAALKFDVPVSGAYEMLCVFEDDPNAKYRAKSIGPCPYGTSSSIHIRGYVENGTNAPIHYTTIGGRAQSGNFIDGVQFGQTGADKKDYQYKSVPDGPHVMRNKINQFIENYQFEDVLGFGFSHTSDTKYRSYGGLKISEAIFFDITSDWETTRDEVNVYQAYLMRKYLNVATLGQVTLLGNATLDTSAAPLKCQLQWTSLSATVTDARNFLPQGYYEAGNPALAVDGFEYNVPLKQTLLPGLSFVGNAAIEVDSTAAVARVDGTGTFAKKGAGTLLLGVHDDRLASLEVQSGELKISPLEASGSWMHVDATASDTMTISEVNGTNFVTKWLDVEHGKTYLSKTTTKYQFAARSVGTPYISDKMLNGMPLIDYGDYTSEVYPNGNGGAFVPSLSLSDTEDNPGMRNFFVVWGDYDEIADLPLYNGKELRGPGILAGDDGWGYRGFGGGGKTYPIFSNPPSRGTYHVSANSFLSIDGESFDHTSTSYTARPSKGMHVLDQQVGSNGAKLHYVGGCKWQAGYYGGAGSGEHPGTWGGVRMGEILIYRNLLPGYFRKRIAAALGKKWFNRESTLSYKSVTVAEGAKLSIPDTIVTAGTLAIGGEFAAEKLVATNITVKASAKIGCDLAIPDGGTVTYACTAEGGAPTLTADSVSAEGSWDVAFTFDSDMYLALSGSVWKLLEGLDSGFSISSVGVSLPADARSKGMRVSLEAKNGALYGTVSFVGFSVIVR